ncbi:MAG: PQQ-dependent sugar dehydrogenase [Verrucomicrobiae bacterium]|nr:PQQ-dependent sugar dehydrogenase [Verrucomicrobiae bacterium]
MSLEGAWEAAGRLAMIASLGATLGAPVHAAPPERKPWTASRIQGSPEAAKRCASEPVFTRLALEQGLELVAHAGRFFVVERGGKIWSFPESNESVADADLLIDLKASHPDLSNAYGLAFHPDAGRNREVFVAYTIGNERDDGTKVSRFRLTGGAPPRIDPASEEILIEWRSGGHNGANLRFGPDGMLYISTGDATAPSPPDSLNTGQDYRDLLSSILRIDIGGKDPGKPYRVPPDNPWVGRADARPEIWAFGFRNPWKMSFDENGGLWVGDVGWELWEMIHLVGRGTNHGWSAMEASQPIKPETASPLAPIVPPVAAHPHFEAASITGGFVYQGSRLPDLKGAYLYGDYETGKIWALWHDGKRVTRHEEIADTPHKIATFGVGSDGELYYIHYGTPATLHRLVANPKAGQAADFPRKLSETGLFRDVGKGEPNDGVYEFAVYEPMWADGAEATRYVALPGASGIDTEIVLKPNGGRQVTVTWPAGAVLAKTIRLGNRRVETQVTHYDGEAWNGYSYRWNEAETDAELVDGAGAEVDVAPAEWKGGARYRVHSRAECLRCHTSWNEFVAGFQPAQLSGFSRFPDQPARETAVALGLTDAEYFERDTGGHLVASDGPGPVEARARSWLHANCAHCHRRHGGGSAPLEVNFDRALSEAALLWERPTRGTFGLAEARAIVPGQPWRSVLNYRVSAIGGGHMPLIGPREVDEEGAKLLWEWVAALPAEKPSPSPDPIPDRFDPGQLADTSSAMHLAHAVATDTLAGNERDRAVAAGLASPVADIRALFERFRPASERPLPRKHDPETILKLTGDPGNGARLLSPTGKLAACFGCHRLGGEGVDFGPDLSDVGHRLDRRQLLESILAPSRSIAPEFGLWTVETKKGESASGFIVERTDDGVALKSGPDTILRFATDEISKTVPVPQSIMPEGQADFLEPGELADVIASLSAPREKGTKK